MNSIYLDHAATAPLDKEILDVMMPFLTTDFGNPSSVHAFGQRARMAVDEAREQVAESLGARRLEIVFTGGGTESDNAAIRGVALASLERGKHLVTTAIEHEAVLETCYFLRQHHGFDVTFVPPGREGFVSPEAIADALRSDTTLVSVMYANNEIGTIQPIRKIGALCRERSIPFHVDAVQACGSIPVDVDDDNIDLLSLSAHKFHGPKGIGVLYVRRKTPWLPLLVGGGQERQRRSGTENVAGIVGLAHAFRKSVSLLDEIGPRLSEMRDYIFDSVTCDVPRAVVNGSRQNRLPNNINVAIPGLSGESLVMALDGEGVMISSGSACASGSLDPSHVVTALGSPADVARSSIRITLGRENTWDQVKQATETLVATIHRLDAVENGIGVPLGSA